MPLEIPGWANKHQQHRQDTWWLGGVLLHCYRCHRHRTRRYSSSLSSWWTLRSAVTTSLCAPCPSTSFSCECDPTEPLTFFNFWHPRSLSSASHMYSQHLTKNYHINQLLWILNFLRVLSQNVCQTLAWFCLDKGHVSSLANPCNNSD